MERTLLNIPMKSLRFTYKGLNMKKTSHYFASATETAHQTEKLILFVIQT